MVKQLLSIFSHFSPLHVLIAGDFMMDTYTTGQTKRVSPEAPVMIFNVDKEESRPGGAGNVVLNLVSLGAKVRAIGRVGSDLVGRELYQSLFIEGVDLSGIVTDKEYKTPIKNRLIAGAQQMLRVDAEKFLPLEATLEGYLIERIPELFSNIQLLAISDYGKGFLSRKLLAALIDYANIKNIPIIVDPKGDDFTKYRGSTLIKPNCMEAYLASKHSLEATLDEVAETLLQITNTQKLLITRSEAGMSLFERKGRRHDFPVKSREVKDVTGAGDTVLAMLSVALGNKLDIEHAVQLSNIAAGIAIEKLGCARITLSTMAEHLLKYNVINKIFDENHLFALMQALKDKRFSVLGVPANTGMTTSLFKAIKFLSERHVDEKLIIYLSDYEQDEELITLLSSLSEVDFIIIGSDSLQHLCNAIHPHEVYCVKGDRLNLVDHPLALITP